ncbi:MAG: hypothetical protein M3247_06375 [Thermoproteota archaeon]|nr:hypothetical protein [Thermoproteota archaeon]
MSAGRGIRLPISKLQGDDRVKTLTVQIDVGRRTQNGSGLGSFRGSWICSHRVDNLVKSWKVNNQARSFYN